MTKIVDGLEGNQQNLLSLLKNQTSVVDSTINLMKQTQEAITNQAQEFNNFMNKTVTVLNGIQQELQEQQSAELFNSLATRLILMITNYQRVQATLLDVVIDTHHGKLNPILLTPQQLQSQIAIIRENVPSTVQLPSIRDNLLELYNIMSVKGLLAANQIIFGIQLPLVTPETYELLKITAVPAPINQTYIAIEPSTKFMLVNLHRDSYYPITDLELEKCMKTRSSVYLCTQHHPLYRRGSAQGACEFSILTQTSIPTTCKVTTVVEAPNWIQLQTPNQWIYSMRESTTIQIYCSNSIYQKILTGSGILTISKGCTLRDKATTIQAHHLYSSAINSSFTPSTNFTDLFPPTTLFHLQYNPISPQSLATNISDLQQRINHLQDQQLLPRTQTHDVHHFSLGYTTLGLIIIIATYIVCKHMLHRKRSTPGASSSTTGQTFEEFQFSSTTSEGLNN